ncbi:MAG TPA: nickel-dependent lactate racemase [Clostridia bacterium]
MEIKIPYSGTYKTLNVDESQIKGILSAEPEKYAVSAGEAEIVRNALCSPIESERLCDIVKGKEKLLLITSDHTRPLPSKITLPILLQEIRSKNPGIEIKILIATGFHRPTTYNEMVNKFGRDIVDNETIINHDCTEEKNLVYKGVLPSGGKLYLNSLVDWADIVISEGFIEPHFFAGFSGGRKSILPGIAGEKTIFANHCSQFIADKNARTGILKENPIHKDMLFAAEKANLAFILNVVINSKKRIIKAFAGDFIKAHEKGCEFVRSFAGIKAVKSDIVITSNGGYPLDQNIYQAVKGMTAAEACVNPGGVIIMAAACNDGHGGESFYRWFAESSSPKETYDKINSIQQDETIADQWEAQILARILIKHKVIMVSDIQSKKLIENMHMIYAASLEEALEKARQLTSADAGIVVIPDGVGVIIRDY